MLHRLRARNEWKFFAVLPKADRSARHRLVDRARSCAACCRPCSPSRWACSSARCSAATASPARSTFVGVVFVLLQVLTPIHQAVSANLGDRTAAWLYDRLTEACVRPPGMAHLEDPTLTSDLDRRARFRSRHDRSAARISMDFIASGLVEMIGGLACAAVLVRLRVVGAARARRRLAGHALAAARERGLARSQHRGGARRAARRRLCVSARRRSGAREGAAAVRPGRLDDRSLRRAPHASARAAVRSDATAREAAGRGACCSSSRANVACSGRCASAASDGRSTLAEVVVFAQARSARR